MIDITGDEADKYGEAIYVYDGTIMDVDLLVIIEKINPRVRLAVISDSCFSEKGNSGEHQAAFDTCQPQEDVRIVTRR